MPVDLRGMVPFLRASVSLQAILFMYSQTVLTTAGAFIALGGLYDVLTPRSPPNLASNWGDNPQARKAIRELLRALGLVGIGVTVAILALHSEPRGRYTICFILILVLPSEGANAFGMYRAHSPFFFVPLSFLALTALGLALALAGV